MTEPTVLYEERGAVAIATLNRPQSLNSFTRQMHRDLGDVMARVEKTYRCEVAAVLPHSDEVMALASAGVFVLKHPDSPVSSELRLLASRLMA